MERENIVVPECYADTNLMNVLTGKRCNHQKGCATVCKTLDEKLKDQFAVAVIDNDKRQPKATEKYVEIGHTESLIVCKHKNRPHYLILINPAIESFVLQAAMELGVVMQEYHLPDNVEDLKKITKSQSAKESEQLARLFKDLREAANVKCLNGVLSYLLDKKYSATDGEIRELLGGYWKVIETDDK